MNNDITALRAHLFETLRQVKGGEIDLDKARAVNEIGKTLIDTARVEVDYLRTTGGGESKFLAVEHQAENGEPGNGITGITRHILRG
jgi:hypothetical protein